MYMPFFEKGRLKKPHPKSKFTDEEDAILRELVEQYGESDWHVIAGHMNGRNARQCRERWRNYLCPDVENGPWTEVEDKLLDEKYALYGPKWKLIATFFRARTDINVKSRWQVHVRRANKKVLTRGRPRREVAKPVAAPLPILPESSSWADVKLSDPPRADPVAPPPSVGLWNDSEFEDFMGESYLNQEFPSFEGSGFDWL